MYIKKLNDNMDGDNMIALIKLSTNLCSDNTSIRRNNTAMEK